MEIKGKSENCEKISKQKHAVIPVRRAAVAQSVYRMAMSWTTEGPEFEFR
jgi:hypothetical protein